MSFPLAAIVFQLGEVKEVVQRSGLHFKWPLLQNVRLFDKIVESVYLTIGGGR